MEAYLESFAFWAFTSMITGGILIMAWTIRLMLHELKSVNESIHELNKRIAITIERQDWHQREINKLEARITALEYNS